MTAAALSTQHELDIRFDEPQRPLADAPLLEAANQLRRLNRQVKQIEEPVPAYILEKTQELQDREADLRQALEDAASQAGQKIDPTSDLLDAMKRMTREAQSLTREAEFLATGPKSSINLLAKLASRLFAGGQQAA